MFGKFILWGLLTAAPVLGQISYVAQKSTSLSAAAEVITVQQPAPSSTNKLAQLKTAFVACSVACTVTLERNGTFASATTLATRNVNTNEAASTLTAWSSSNVGTGIVLQVAPIAAGGYLVFDLSNPSINLKPFIGTSENFTIRISSITGTAYITINWTEQ